MTDLNKFFVDVVMCIDKTGSMHYIFDEIKGGLEEFCSSMSAASLELGRAITQLRIKVIVFGDYKYDDDPMSESEFFTMPEDLEALRAFLGGVNLGGGGDIEEDALEALSLALRSDFSDGARRRHIVMMFSDSPAHKLSTNAHCPAYPNDMPSDIWQLKNRWEGKDPSFSGSYHARSGRLVAFVPECEPWIELETWERYIALYPSPAVSSEYAGVFKSIDFCKNILI